MRLDWRQISIIARREYLATVRRKAFLFTALGTPAYFALVMTLSIGPQMTERVRAMKNFTTLGVVDSSGLFGNAEREIKTDMRLDENPFAKSESHSFRTQVRFFASQGEAERSLRSDSLSQLLVIPRDYLETGRARRYARSSNLFSGADRRSISAWLAQGLIAGEVDPQRAERVAHPAVDFSLYTLDKQNQFELKDDKRELVEFMMPMMMALLLGVCIIAGGQYLLQGIAEEKESRILESLLCTVNPQELLGGKLLGLGAAGLTLVALWMSMGIPLMGATAAMVPIHLPKTLLLFGLLYFILGYLFYGALMTGIGAMTSNMREAQQFAIAFTFSNFAPFLMLSMILGRPDSPLAVGLSLFPPTAATTMMLRMTAPAVAVPLWQILLSLALLAGAAFLALVASARVFRIGLLMYGKTPNLPEILRWARRG